HRDLHPFPTRRSSDLHPMPMILRSSGALEIVGKPGTLLGLFPDPELSDDTIDLEPGDVMVVYTDGVTDSPGFEAGTGERRLSEVDRKSTRLNSSHLVI